MTKRLETKIPLTADHRGPTKHRNTPKHTGIHRNTPEYTGIHVRIYLIINVIMSYVMFHMAKFGVEYICTC